MVKKLLEQQGVTVSTRTCQEYLEDRRRAKRAAEVATVRFETAPGHQMQIDFGQKLVRIAGALIRVHLLVAVLSFSPNLRESVPARASGRLARGHRVGVSFFRRRAARGAWRQSGKRWCSTMTA